jgi:hypothetical protein
MFWYDVCNDMTLELRKEQKTPSDITKDWIAEDGYFWDGVAFIQYEDEGEIYFLSRSPNLHGVELT